MKKSLRYAAAFAAATLALGVSVPTANAAKTYKACLALDTGGVDDKSFNASAWSGAQSAAKKNKNVTVKFLAATTDADYAPNIKKLVDEKCDVIVGVGFLINGAIVEAAKANPTIKFAIVDQDGQDHGADGSVYPGKSFPNLKPLQFATDQSSFQAGYLAAGFSKTGKVATYGGMNIPPVTIFMNGYALGVAYYNKVHKTSVSILGWDTTKKDGTFVGNFSDQAKALQISKNFEDQGADVIFPVAGGLAAATAQNAMASKKSVVIWVDSDGYVQAPQFKSVLLVSVVKGVDVSVESTILDVAKGKYSAAQYLGTIKNRGTYISSYHDLAKKVPSKLQNEVHKLGSDIVSGKVKVA